MTRLAAPLTHKTCTNCYETKPLADFYRKSAMNGLPEPYPDTQPAGWYAECKDCFKARIKRDREIS